MPDFGLSGQFPGWWVKKFVTPLQLLVASRPLCYASVSKRSRDAREQDQAYDFERCCIPQCFDRSNASF